MMGSFLLINPTELKNETFTLIVSKMLIKCNKTKACSSWYMGADILLILIKFCLDHKDPPVQLNNSMEWIEIYLYSWQHITILYARLFIIWVTRINKRKSTTMALVANDKIEINWLCERGGGGRGRGLVNNHRSRVGPNKSARKI